MFNFQTNKTKLCIDSKWETTSGRKSLNLVQRQLTFRLVFVGLMWPPCCTMDTPATRSILKIFCMHWLEETSRFALHSGDIFFFQELLEDGLLEHFHKRLVELNMDSAEELQSYINKLQMAVEQGRQKLLEGKTEVGLTPMHFFFIRQFDSPVIGWKRIWPLDFKLDVF